jgi:hypothetical protein
MKMKFLYQLLIVLFLVPVFAYAQKAEKSPRTNDIREYKKELKLDDKQMAKIDSIHKVHKPKINSIDCSTNDKAAIEKKQKARQEMNKEINSVLTKEQKKKFAEMRKKNKPKKKD